MNCTATHALAIQQTDPRTVCRSCGVREHIPFQPHCGLCEMEAQMAFLRERFSLGPTYLLDTKTGELKLHEP